MVSTLLKLMVYLVTQNVFIRVTAQRLQVGLACPLGTTGTVPGVHENVLISFKIRRKTSRSRNVFG